jgi:1-phosphofructokinase family hexose kinase
MIVTFTPNPSVDKTVTLPAALERGEVQRATEATSAAGGKGINVARVLAWAGEQVVPVLAITDEAFTRELGDSGMTAACRLTQAGLHVRTNTTITEPDGTTTKINEPGPTLTAAQIEAAEDELLAHAEGAAWVILSGALPPGAPVDWYARLVRRLRPLGCKIAVDTSDAALSALMDALPGAAFDLVKPNSDELAQLTGGDAAAFEAAAKAGDLHDISVAAKGLHERGIANVLVTLGGAGALLVNAEGAWYTTAPKVAVKSTVGAGDSSVAGFVLGSVRGLSPAECLVTAAAHGSAAASLPGTQLPHPMDVHPEQASVRRIN